VLGVAAILPLVAACETVTLPTVADPGDPLPGISDDHLSRFLLGKALFGRLTIEEEGLGPLFNETRCSACHDQPTSGGSGPALVTKATRYQGGTCDALRAQGGDNFQSQATAALREHGISGETIPTEANGRTLVTGPSLYGLGLIAAIPASRILGRADPDDADGDGISGIGGQTESGRFGRFGRKGEVETISDFVDTALRFELGLTTHLHPQEETVNGVPIPAGTDPMPEPEIDERGLNMLTSYMRFLAAPPRAVPSSTAGRDSVDQGEGVFTALGCADCHVPSMQTVSEDTPLLDGRTVELFSDLLLHDMGDALADVCGPNAAPGEYRTARLWGLRFRGALLHDGRAATPRDAILLHGGEASAAREAFLAADAEQRAFLLSFLGSL
jgi:CxxC motif-containing protein (DUF1111 family)